MTIKSSEDGRATVRARWAQHNSERIVERVGHLVDNAPPLTDAQRIILAAILDIKPAHIPVRHNADSA